MDSLFASRCPMHPTQTPELKEMQVRRMWVISHQPRPLVRSCSTQTRHQVSSRFSSHMCPFTPLPTLKDDHRSLPANPGSSTEMDTGGDFCSLVHKPAETPNYNLNCSPANPTPYEPPFEFTSFRMAGFGADGPPYPLSGMPNGNMNSSFMPRGAGVFEDVSTCLSRSSLGTTDNENFLAVGAQTCWKPR